ncbi:MAG: nucleotide exchange factor GrpE [Pseudomonadales bacterium]|nr:nucleotide exchange factor GrpE [Gammaproteobacteria bacterium]NNL56193.1 nucleotide exchange factor GrpE [Pseudomonadales bacterium]
MADKQDSTKPEVNPQTGEAEELATLDEPEATEALEPASALQQEIEALQQQLAEAKEQALRAAAEMQNVRKRAERDVANAHKYGQEKLISSLLPVLDNLDRALEAAGKGSAEAEPATSDDNAADSDAMQSILEGVELTRKSALDVLRQFSVEVLEPYGEPFDPQLHEAMTMVPSETAEPNSVIDVLQKGYRLNGRLLRAAMVVVAKP